MNSVELIKSICKERKIPISRLEKDLGFANGYIGQLKKGTLPADRLDKVAKYLGVTSDYLLGKEKAPTGGERKSDVLDEVDVAFYGDYKELTEKNKDTIRQMALALKKLQEAEQE